MPKKFYHSEGCNSAVMEFEKRTILYVIKPSEVNYSQEPRFTYHITSDEFKGRTNYHQELEPLPPKITIPKRIIVVGSVVSGEYARIEKPGQIPVTEVEPITNKSERKELTDLLRREERIDKVSFWD